MGNIANESKQTITDLLGSRFDTKHHSSTPSRGKEYKMPCPFCGGDDRFVVWIDNNTWSCRQCVGSEVPQQDVIEFVKRDKGLDFKAACEFLGIELSKGDKTRVNDSKRQYTSLADYAQEKGVPVSVFSGKKWIDDTWQNRPAIVYPTYHGENGSFKQYNRVRFMDGNKPTYKPCETGTPSVWYGLKSAIDIATSGSSPLILCNGESSTLVAQYYQVPAFCRTGGEKELTGELLAQLKKSWQGQLIIALDCDKAGQDAAEKIKVQLPDAVLIDLGLTDGGDVADFCKLYELNSLKEIIARIPIKTPRTVKEASDYVLAIARNEVVGDGRTLTFPYKIFHHLGGLVRYMPPGKLSLFFGMSGHGKTSFVEPMMEFWQERGNNGIFSGKEFEPDEYEFRRFQRYSGQAYQDLDGTSKYIERVSFTEFLGHKKWQEENRDNTPNFLRDGKRIDGKKSEAIEWVNRLVSRWIGEVKYPDNFGYLEDLLDWARGHIRKERSEGRHVDYMVFDYIQLYFLRENGTAFNAVQAALYKIKDFAIEMQIHTIVLSQVNKSSDGDQRKLNKPLTVQDMNFINDAPANLTISLNIHYSESNETDWQGNLLAEKHRLSNGTFAGMAWVLKNSMEETGQVKMQADLARYRWLDVGYTLTSIDLNSDRTYEEQIADAEV